MSGKTRSGNRFLILAVSVFAILLCLIFARPAHARAAVYKMVYEKPVKVGSYYYRVSDKGIGGDHSVYVYQRSKKKNAGYKNLIIGTQNRSLSGSFTTDGKKLYYCQKKGKHSYLMCQTIRSKKNKTVKTYKNTACTAELEGIFGKNLYVIQRSGKNEGVCLDRINVSTGKKKTLYKNFAVWNTLDALIGNTRYLAVSPNKNVLTTQDGSQLSRLIVLDKKTGKSRTISKTSTRANTNVSGANASFYRNMTKKVMYSEYDREKKTWYIKQYTFSTKKTVTLNALPDVQEISSITYNGNGADITYKQRNQVKSILVKFT